MKKFTKSLTVLTALSLALISSPNFAHAGAMAAPSKNIVETAVGSKDLSTLVAAVKAAGLVETLQGQGPFTVFAPTNEAFNKLPAGTVETLLKPENKAQLVAVLTYHVVPGKISAQDVLEKIKAGNGQATVKTVQGEDLTLKLVNGQVKVIDSKGNVATVTTADLNQSNGVVHIIDSVLLP